MTLILRGGVSWRSRSPALAPATAQPQGPEDAPGLQRCRDPQQRDRHQQSSSAAASLLAGELQLEAKRNPASASRVRAGFEEQLNRFAGWIDEALKSTAHRPVLSSYELACSVMALPQGFAQQPSDRTAVKDMMAFGRRRFLNPLEFDEAGRSDQLIGRSSVHLT